jgi:hypothetical protein
MFPVIPNGRACPAKLLERRRVPVQPEKRFLINFTILLLDKYFDKKIHSSCRSYVDRAIFCPGNTRIWF